MGRLPYSPCTAVSADDRHVNDEKRPRPLAAGALLYCAFGER